MKLSSNYGAGPAIVSAVAWCSCSNSPTAFRSLRSLPSGSAPSPTDVLATPSTPAVRHPGSLPLDHQDEHCPVRGIRCSLRGAGRGTGRARTARRPCPAAARGPRRGRGAGRSTVMRENDARDIDGVLHLQYGHGTTQMVVAGSDKNQVGCWWPCNSTRICRTLRRPGESPGVTGGRRAPAPELRDAPTSCADRGEVCRQGCATVGHQHR